MVWSVPGVRPDVLGVVGSRDHAQLVRCHPADGACELIQDLPATWKSWRWATNGPSGPNSSTPAPNTTQPTEPFIEGTTLHAHGLTFEVGRHTNLVAAGTTVLVGHWGKSITWRTLRDDRLVPLPYGTGAVPVLSPDGRRVAVSTNPTQQTSRITVYDGRTDAVIAHVDLALPATCCDGGSVQQLSVDDDGTVHWVEDRGPEAPAMTWRPGSAPVRVGSAGS